MDQNFILYIIGLKKNFVSDSHQFKKHKRNKKDDKIP